MVSGLFAILPVLPLIMLLTAGFALLYLVFRAAAAIHWTDRQEDDEDDAGT